MPSIRSAVSTENALFNHYWNLPARIREGYRVGMSPTTSKAEVLEIEGREVRISSPDKVVFPEPGITKLELVQYYLGVADGALRGVAGRPMVLKRFVKGIEEEAFFQKRAPANVPPGIETAHVTFPSGRSADLCVVDDVADLATPPAVPIDPFTGKPYEQALDVKARQLTKAEALEAAGIRFPARSMTG